MFPLIQTAYASSHITTAQGLVDKINTNILFPLIALMMALAFVIFLWGAFEYVKNSNNESARETGRNHLMYGVIGMLIMLSAFAILSIAAGTFGIDVQRTAEENTRSPFAPESSLRPTARPTRAPAATAAPTPPTPSDPIPIPPAPVVPPPVADYQFVLDELMNNGVSYESALVYVQSLTRDGQSIAIFTDALSEAVREGLISDEVRNQMLAEGNKNFRPMAERDVILARLKDELSVDDVGTYYDSIVDMMDDVNSEPFDLMLNNLIDEGFITSFTKQGLLDLSWENKQDSVLYQAKVKLYEENVSTESLNSIVMNLSSKDKSKQMTALNEARALFDDGTISKEVFYEFVMPAFYEAQSQ